MIKISIFASAKLVDMQITTHLYKIEPEGYAAIIAQIMLKKYRFIIYVVLLLLLVASLTIPDFKYAAIVLILAVVPFAMFNVTMVSMGMFKLDIVFKPKHLVITNAAITEVEPEGETTRYGLQRVEYKYTLRKKYILTIDGNILLIIPYSAFKTQTDHQEFKNLYVNRINSGVES